MKIAKITKHKNNAKILLENNESVFIRYEVFVKNALRKGDEISDELISSLKFKNEKFLAKELERKLLLRKIDKNIIPEIISYLKENNYLNDENFAKIFIDEKKNRKMQGVNKLKNQLRSKGVSSEVIENLVEEDFETEFENASILAKKKLHQLENKNLHKRELIQKLSSYLAGKGFSFDTIRKVVNKTIGEEEEI